jgi:RHS repeat-associated protein
LTTATWPDGAQVRYGYDSATGRRTSMTDPDGNTHAYGYANTATNKGLASVTLNMPGWQQGLGPVSYVRDARGRLSTLTQGSNAVQQDFTYDTHNRLASFSLHSTFAGGPNTPLHQESYTYDALDRRTRVDYAAQTGAGGALTATRREWGYDQAGRLIREERFASANGTNPMWGRYWGYDAAGNRSSVGKFDGAYLFATNPADPPLFNAWNQREQDWSSPGGYGWMMYDDEGNQTYRMMDERYFYWDRSNRLTMTDVGPGMDAVTYGYDPSGRLIDRIGISGTKEKRYYADGLSPILVKQWDAGLNGGAGGWKTMRTALQTPGVIGHVAAEREATAWNGSGTPTSFMDRFYHYDPLGNTVLETGVNATVLARTDMEAYGEMVRESNAAGTWSNQPDNSGGGVTDPLLGAANRPRQTTKETDPDTGLKWFGARWYDPAMGSWLSPEPLGMDGPNFYWATFADPVNYLDFDGRKSQARCKLDCVRSFMYCIGFTGTASGLCATGCLALTAPPLVASCLVFCGGFAIGGGIVCTLAAVECWNNCNRLRRPSPTPTPKATPQPTPCPTVYPENRPRQTIPWLDDLPPGEYV